MNKILAIAFIIAACAAISLLSDTPVGLGYHGSAITVGAYDQNIGTLTHAGTVTLDFSANNRINDITITGNVTIATSNLAAGKVYQLTIKGCSTNSLATWPAWTHWYPGVITNILASKWTKLSLVSHGTTDADVEAGIVQEP